MAKATALDILNQTRELVAIHLKQAEFAAVSGENVNAIPGPGKDAPIPAGSEAPQPGVKDRFPNEPASVRSGEGAGEDGTAKITQKQVLDASQPAPVAVAKEPEITGDANADRPSEKAASQLATDLLADIRSHKARMSKVASAPRQAHAPTNPRPAPVAETKQAEPVDMIELDQAVLAKIAAVILCTKDGWDFAEKALTKAAGDKAAYEVLGHVQARSQAIDAEQSFKAGSAAAESQVQDMLAKQLEQSHANAYYQGYAAATKAAGVNAPAPATVADMQKAAAADYAAGQKAAELALVKAAQDQYAYGQALADQVIVKYAQDVAAMDDPKAQQAAAEMATAPEAGGAPPEGAAPAAEQAAGDLSDATPEEIGSALAELVQDGTIPQEEAMKIVDAIDSAEGGGADGEGGAAPAPAEGQ